jgi:hypothetical protein
VCNAARRGTIVNNEIHMLVIGEVLLMLLIVFGIYARQRIVRLLFQRRRRAHMNIGASSSSVLPIVTAARKDAWEAFINDKKLVRAYGVTPREIESLRNGSLLGSVTCKEDILFILKTVRGSGRRG